MAKFDVQVEQNVTVELDEQMFNEAFMAEFRESFFEFDTLEEHAAHLAQLYARGIADDDQFIEGYGPASAMGIRFTFENVELSHAHYAREYGGSPQFDNRGEYIGFTMNAAELAGGGYGDSGPHDPFHSGKD